MLLLFDACFYVWCKLWISVLLVPWKQQLSMDLLNSVMTLEVTLDLEFTDRYTSMHQRSIVIGQCKHALWHVFDFPGVVRHNLRIVLLTWQRLLEPPWKAKHTGKWLQVDSSITVSWTCETTLGLNAMLCMFTQKYVLLWSPERMNRIAVSVNLPSRMGKIYTWYINTLLKTTYLHVANRIPFRDPNSQSLFIMRNKQ